jgi:hypothetical protein
MVVGKDLCCLLEGAIKKHAPVKARDLAAEVSNQHGMAVSRKDINSILYKWKEENRVSVDESFFWSWCDFPQSSAIDNLSDIPCFEEKDIDSSSLEEVLGECAFEVHDFDSSAFFGVSKRKGNTIIVINSSHDFYKYFYSSLSKEQLKSVNFCLAGWARMERECTSKKRLKQFELARRDWGLLLSDFLDGSLDF